MLNMIDSVNPNAVSLRSTDFAFMTNPNVAVEDREIALSLTFSSYLSRVFYPPISSVPLVTFMMITHKNLVGIIDWLSQMGGKSYVYQ